MVVLATVEAHNVDTEVDVFWLTMSLCFGALSRQEAVDVSTKSAKKSSRLATKRTSRNVFESHKIR